MDRGCWHEPSFEDGLRVAQALGCDIECWRTQRRDSMVDSIYESLLGPTADFL